MVDAIKEIMISVLMVMKTIIEKFTLSQLDTQFIFLPSPHIFVSVSA